MNKKTQLEKAQFRLTIIFTLLVFIIAWVLQLSFFTFKYYSGILKETKKLNFISKTIDEKHIPLHQLNKLIKDERKLWESKNHQRELQIAPRGKIMNFAILDSYNNVLIQNIRWNIDIEAVRKVMNQKTIDVEVENNTIIKYIPIQRTIETYQLLLFKELNYDFDAYISDILRFFLAIWLFSILFFFIGYIFVRKNLKPVEKNIIEMNDFVHNAGHELKTPISVIHSNLQLMKQFKSFKEDMLDENLLEINRLNNLIEALVTITDIQENQSLSVNSIQKEIDYILEEYSTIIQDKNLEIKHIQSIDFSVNSDKEYLYILLSNIIKNAIKFSKNWEVINISFMDNKCIIQDFWEGIEEKNIEKIFDRFFQEKQSRNNEGFGIGLALVSKISHIYNWKIKVESKKWEWAKFIINFK